MTHPFPPKTDPAAHGAGHVHGPALLGAGDATDAGEWLYVRMCKQQKHRETSSGSGRFQPACHQPSEFNCTPNNDTGGARRRRYLRCQRRRGHRRRRVAVGLEPLRIDAGGRRWRESEVLRARVWTDFCLIVVIVERMNETTQCKSIRDKQGGFSTPVCFFLSFFLRLHTSRGRAN